MLKNQDHENLSVDLEAVLYLGAAAENSLSPYVFVRADLIESRFQFWFPVIWEFDMFITLLMIHSMFCGATPCILLKVIGIMSVNSLFSP